MFGNAHPTCYYSDFSLSMKQSNSVVPTFDSMFVPTIQALQALGGSGTTEEIYEQVIQILNLSDEVLEILHGSTSQSKVAYRLAWSRTYLKKYGLLQNSGRGVWSLVSTAIDAKNLERIESNLSTVSNNCN
jgi:restriction system protein